MALEYTLTLIDPTGIARGIAGRLMVGCEASGLKMVDMKLHQPGEKLVREWSEDPEAASFPEQLAALLAAPSLAILWQGEEAVAKARQVIEETMTAKTGSNLVHGSRTAAKGWSEAVLWFPERFEGAADPAAVQPTAAASPPVATERTWTWLGDGEAELEKAW